MTGAELLPLVKAKGKGDRYSENFMKWLRKHKDREVSVVFLHWSNIDGSHVERVEGKTQPQQILIGSQYPDEEGYFFGTRLSEIIGKGVRAERYAFPPGFKKTPLPDWLDGYIKGGKCFIDPEHRLYHDKERWQVSEDGNSRECLWCGNHRQVKVVKRRVVKDTFWRPA